MKSTLTVECTDCGWSLSETIEKIPHFESDAEKRRNGRLVAELDEHKKYCLTYQAKPGEKL